VENFSFGNQKRKGKLHHFHGVLASMLLPEFYNC